MSQARAAPPGPAPRLRAVLFDAAGTLIELREPLGESYARAAARHGAPLPAWRLEQAFRRVHRAAPPPVFPDRPLARVAEDERGWWRDLVRATFRAADQSVRFDDFDALFAELWQYFAQPAAWRARSGAHVALRALRRRGLATGVVSNFDLRLGALLRGLDLTPLLDVIVLPAHAAAVKPDPRIFQLALAQLAVAASEAVYVGDDVEHDVEGARAAGLRAVHPADLATLEALPQQLEELAREPGP